MKKRVGVYKETGIAWAPDELVNCINKYSDKYEARIVTPNMDQMDLVDGNTPCLRTPEINESDFDIMHFHNKFKVVNIPSVMQYHSEAYLVQPGFQGPELVVAQYQATLYPHCKPVKNIIDIYDYEKYPIGSRNNAKVRVGFFPSDQLYASQGGTNRCSKGYPETLAVLDRLKAKFGSDVEFDIQAGHIPLRECLKRKAACHILFDEVVTNSYHRSGLEGLTLGSLTFCSMNKAVEDILKTAAGTDIVPFENVGIDKLEAKLSYYLYNPEYIVEAGKRNRMWMGYHWNPKDIVKEYEAIYDEVIADHG